MFNQFKNKIIFSTLLVSVSCSQFQIKKEIPVEKKEVQIIKVEQSPQEIKKEEIKNKIGFICKTCTDSELIKVKKAELKSNEIVQSKCFEDFMLSWGLIWKNGMTDKQVISHIKNAALTVPVHYYWGNCNVVGYRQPPKPDIYFNRCSHNQYKDTPWGICQTASNATHEWSHSIGFDHPFNKTWNRGKTVPYAINQAFNKCCK